MNRRNFLKTSLAGAALAALPRWALGGTSAGRRHVAFGQVESAFRVFNVLLHEGNLVFSAGRHWGMDGGATYTPLIRGLARCAGTRG